MEPVSRDNRVEVAILFAWLADDDETAYTLMRQMDYEDLSHFNFLLDGLQDASLVVMDELRATRGY